MTIICLAWDGDMEEACGLVGFDVLAAEENIFWLGFITAWDLFHRIRNSKKKQKPLNPSQPRMLLMISECP